MLPQAVPQPTLSTTTTGGQLGAIPTPGQTPDGTPSSTTPTATSGAQPSGAPASQTQVELTFSADRNQLFTAWNAIANLADIAGKVTVTVKAEKADGLDNGKLQNGVIEPLKEADLID